MPSLTTEEITTETYNLSEKINKVNDANQTSYNEENSTTVNNPQKLTSNNTYINSKDSSRVDNNNNLYITEDQASWFGSLLLLGACLGSIFSSFFVSLGRRRSVLISAVPRLIGWLLIASASSVNLLYLGRIFTGLSLGMVTSAAPLYISEIAQPSTRGALGCIVQLGVNIGIFISALAGK